MSGNALVHKALIVKAVVSRKQQSTHGIATALQTSIPLTLEHCWNYPKKSYKTDTHNPGNVVEERQLPKLNLKRFYQRFGTRLRMILP